MSRTIRTIDGRSLFVLLNLAERCLQHKQEDSAFEFNNPQEVASAIANVKFALEHLSFMPVGNDQP